MPTTVISSTNRPTFLEKPEIRFATTFLSSEYRDYSVEGEAIMDKMSGEIFLKRPVDGKVISFDQNKKYLHDLVFELRVLLTNNESFYYPADSIGGYYVCTNYDMVSINNEVSSDIQVNDTIIDNTSESTLHQFLFNLSNQTNGFFIRPMTRDCDKAAVEYMTNQYDKLMKTYIGSNKVIKDEQDKWEKSEVLGNTNIHMEYDVIVSDAFDTKTYSQTAEIHFNEGMCVLLPMTQIDKDFKYGYNSCTIKIKSFTYPKIRFVLANKVLMDGDFEENMAKFLAPDKKIYMNFVNVMSFVNNAGSIKILGNESIIALLDIPYVRRYMAKMAKLKSNSSWIQCIKRPDDDIWTANTVWAEVIRDVYKGGEEVWRGSETDVDRMEIYFSNTKHYEHSAIIVVDETKKEDFFLDVDKSSDLSLEVVDNG